MIMLKQLNGRRSLPASEIVVIGSGPGGAVTATLLAEAGRDVTLIEEGSHLPLSSAPHFSREEILQKYRNGGINVALGPGKVSYVEGCCVGGGSEVNRGLYHRAGDELLDKWQREFRIEAFDGAKLRPHYEACEQTTRISLLPGEAPAISLKLKIGADQLGWNCVEAPRLFEYVPDWRTGRLGTKQSMTETCVPRFLAAGGTLIADTRIDRLTRRNGRWHLHGSTRTPPGGRVPFELAGATVFVACGAVHMPALLRRSGLSRNIGDSLAWHPMIKVVACFPEEVNQPGDLEPVHQVKQFDPRFSMGCSISKRPSLALALAERPEGLAEVDRNWRHMAIYYAQTTGGRGSVRTLPLFRDPVVRAHAHPTDLQDLAAGLRQLGTCLFAAGADTIYPCLKGFPVLRSEADLARLPTTLVADRANLTALHIFSSCPMGEDQARCATNSFGQVHRADDLYIADASLFCGPTVVNPQGTVMAVARRNAMKFLDGRTRPRQSQSATRWPQETNA